MSDYESIQFENMSGFSNIPSETNESPIEDTFNFENEKEYDSLYEELLEKCNPNCFIEPFDKIKFDTANVIYSKILKTDKSDQFALERFRNQAISELNIHFSTKKIYRLLHKCFLPSVYTSQQPYNAARVGSASDYYSKLLASKNDIVALEALANEAFEFIQQYDKDIRENSDEYTQDWKEFMKIVKKRKEEEKKMKRQVVLISTLVFIAFLTIIGLNL